MNFPLDLRFKLLAFSPQIYVKDAAGAEIIYIKQKLFKLREAITLYADHTQSREVGTIRANKIIDWSARYDISDQDGASLGAVGRKGFRSLWAAHYEVFDAAGELAGHIREENPFSKLVDGFISEIPVVGLLSGYLFHPRYVLTDAAGAPLLRLSKQNAFLEGRFSIEQLQPTSDAESIRNVLALLMLVLLERRRG